MDSVFVYRVVVVKEMVMVIEFKMWPFSWRSEILLLRTSSRDASTFYRIGENAFALGTFVDAEEVAMMSTPLQIICHKSLGKDSGFCRRQHELFKYIWRKGNKKSWRGIRSNILKCANHFHAFTLPTQYHQHWETWYSSSLSLWSLGSRNQIKIY